MGRMTRLVPAILTGAFLLLLLSACLNPFDFVASVTDQVMQAKNLYLVVNEVTPENNEVEVNTWGSIYIVFDRDINPGTVTTGTVVLDPAKPWTRGYNSATKTLSITPSALDSKSSYTVTLTSGIKGADGSALRDPYSWSFTTKTAPGGSLEIRDLTDSGTQYTNDANVTLGIGYNGEVQDMRVSNDPTMFDLGAHPEDPSWEVKGTSKAWTLAAGADGARTVYIQFKDADGNRTPPLFEGDPTPPISASTTYDITPPIVNAGTFPAYLTIAAPSRVPGATASDATSGVESYLWDQIAGAANAVTFSDPTILNPTITGAIIDQTAGVQVRLTATDAAGNPASSTGAAFTVDRIAPGAPDLSGTLSPGSALPSYSWVTGGGGSGNYRRNFDGGTWYTATSPYTPASMEYGGHYFYVQERDWAVNWSASASWLYFYFPTWLRPVHNSTGNSRTPLLIFGVGLVENKGGVACVIYGGLGEKDLRLIDSFTLGFGALYQYQIPKPLPATTWYYWQYETTPSGDKTYTSPVYRFRTGL